MAAAAVVFFHAGWLVVSGAAIAAIWSTVRVRLDAPSGVTSTGMQAPMPAGTSPLSVGRASLVLSALAAVLLGAAIVARTIAVERPPYATLWEYSLVLGFGVVACTLLFERRYGREAMAPVAAVALASAAALLTVAVVAFPSEIEPLMPALQNNRLLAIHVAAMVVSYSALAIAFAAAVVYLLQRPRDRFGWLPGSSLADEIQDRAVMVGFPILGLGIALGAYWGHHAWGRYWAWDPKETTALASWLIFAGYLHARSLRGWRGTRTSLLTLLGFGAILFNIFVVNFVISGLHSYAGV